MGRRSVVRASSRGVEVMTDWMTLSVAARTVA